jgi:hypothetical protein
VCTDRFCRIGRAKPRNPAGIFAHTNHQPHRPRFRTTSSSSRLPAGDDVPAGTVAVVRSPLALRCSTEQNALHTLIHQRHLTPSCRGHAPTAERTLDPARIIGRELDPRPGIREQPGSTPVIENSEPNVRNRKRKFKLRTGQCGWRMRVKYKSP